MITCKSIARSFYGVSIFLQVFALEVSKAEYYCYTLEQSEEEMFETEAEGQAFPK